MRSTLLSLALFATLSGGLGCTSTPVRNPASVPPAPGDPAPPDIDLQISEVFLSPGDEVRVAVFQHPELDRKIAIPPTQRIFYPVVGEIRTAGMSLEALRLAITEGLASAGEHRFAVGDEISVRIFRQDDLTTRAIVLTDGSVQIPLAGKVAIKGLTRVEAIEAIQEALSDYLMDPQVIVDVLSSSSSVLIENPQVSVEAVKLSGQKVMVLGEVKRPGVFAVEGTMSLVDAISRAGGLTEDAEPRNVAVVHTTGPEPDPRVLNLASLLKDGDLTQNPTLQTGDVVFVPRSLIAGVDRFFEHLYTVVRPIVEVETGIWLGQNIDEGPRDGGGPTTLINVDRN